MAEVEDILFQLFGNLEGITQSQWVDAQRSSVRSPETDLWIAILEDAISLWLKFKANPKSYLAWKDAWEVWDWVYNDNFTFHIVAEQFSVLTGVDIDLFRKKFKEWVGREPHDPRVKLQVVYPPPPIQPHEHHWIEQCRIVDLILVIQCDCGQTKTIYE